MHEEALKISHIYKSFGGVHALTDMNLSFKKGEIIGLCGANGAGKSTLLNIVYGVYPQDKGQIFVDGKELTKNSPIIAQESGMSLIFQHRRLIEKMSVAENIFLGKMPKKKGRINYKKMRQDAATLLKELDLNIDPCRIVNTLSAEEKQLVEIVKAYSRNPKIFLLDEPTSALRQHGVEKLFEIMTKLKNKGAAVVFITHRLKEIIHICDKIAIIKDGKLVMEGDKSEFTAPSIAAYMSGDKFSKEYTKHTEETKDKDEIPAQQRIQYDKVLIKVDKLTVGNAKEIDFKVHPGEIVGFAGLGGSGIQDIFDNMFGLNSRISGKVTMLGKDINPQNPIEAIKYGIGYVPEDRQLCGEFLTMTIRDNICITGGQKNSYFSRIKFRKEKKATEEYIKTLGIKTPSGDTIIQDLSGGNQQKAVIAKWLHINADLLVLNEPTAGIDVKAKSEMIRFIKKLSAQGKGVMYSTSYITELMDVSDRILVVYKGKLIREYKKEEFNNNSIFLAINGITEQSEEKK